MLPEMRRFGWAPSLMRGKGWVRGDIANYFGKCSRARGRHLYNVSTVVLSHTIFLIVLALSYHTELFKVQSEHMVPISTMRSLYFQSYFGIS